MDKIKVITDSTSDLSPALAAQYDIEVIPLVVTLGDRTYRDGVDLSPDQFYPLLETTSDLPKTSQVSPGEFLQHFEHWLSRGYQVLSIHLSQGLSGTVDSARTAATQLRPDLVKVVDSKFLSFALAFQAIEAAQLAAAGHSMQAVLDGVKVVRDKMELLFTLDTMHYLQKGGRIGRVSALLGSLLNIKPLIRVVDGVYVPFGRTRNQIQALERFVEFMTEKAGSRPIRVAVGHGHALDAALRLKEMVAARLNVAGDIPLFEVGPVIGTHTGPGTVGAAFYPL
ncbi:MAG: DegV family protein [Symbiobacteriia bacterium]